MKEAEGKVGAPIKVTGFVRYALGEGIDKQESDFAAEVAARQRPEVTAGSSRLSADLQPGKPPGAGEGEAIASWLSRSTVAS